MNLSKLVAKAQNYFYNDFDFNSLCFDFINKKVSAFLVLNKLKNFFPDLAEFDIFTFIYGVETYNFNICADYKRNFYYIGGRDARLNFQQNNLEHKFYLRRIKKEVLNIQNMIESGELEFEEVDGLIRFGLDPEIVKCWKKTYNEYIS